MRKSDFMEFSVAIATYNGEKYIKQQIESIIKNFNKEKYEIIISDDGSTDKTLEIINKMNKPNIKIINGPKKGIIKNFENAIKNCTGKIIFLCDQDDIWFPYKVKTIKEYFEKDNYLLIVHDNIVVNSKLEIINESFFEQRKCKNGFINNIVKNSFIGCCMAFKSELKDEILPIPDDMMMHDQWIGLIALLNGKVKFIDDKLILYRRHQKNNSGIKKNSVIIMIKNRFIILKNLIKYRRQHEK